MSLKLSATYRIQTQTPQLILNLASKKARGRSPSLKRNPRDLHNRDFLSGWSSRPAPTSSTTPRAGFPTGGICLSSRRWCARCWGSVPSAWEAAQSVMGELPAAIVVAAILQRGAAITSAGGYLRELTRKAEAGEFTLGPMLMALIGSAKPRKEEGVAGWRARSAQKPFLLSRGYRRRGGFSGNAAMSSRHGSKTAAPQCCKSFVLRETR